MQILLNRSVAVLLQLCSPPPHHIVNFTRSKWMSFVCAKLNYLGLQNNMFYIMLSSKTRTGQGFQRIAVTKRSLMVRTFISKYKPLFCQHFVAKLYNFLATEFYFVVTRNRTTIESKFSKQILQPETHFRQNHCQAIVPVL
jgi:hypothetical protein